jgi:hypothetical protein
VTICVTWRPRHEDVATALQKLRNPVAVDALYTAAIARHDYLAYDELFGLARKCAWALADIGSNQRVGWRGK